MKSPPHTASDDQLLRRIRGEYLEMPGLCLTCEQAQRLWALDAPTCVRLLKSLVDAKFLQRTANGRYAMISNSAVHRLPMRMVKADIDMDGWVRPVQRMRSPG